MNVRVCKSFKLSESNCLVIENLGKEALKANFVQNLKKNKCSSQKKMILLDLIPKSNIPIPNLGLTNQTSISPN